MKKKVLFMVQVPPPTHGASLCNLSLVESSLLNLNFEIKLHPLSFVKTLSEIGSVSIGKIFKAVIYAVKLTGILISFRPHVVYFTITPAGGAFVRDVLFTAILKFFRKKIVFHLHGIGIKEAMTKSKFSNLLYRFVFNGSNIICLSKLQLKDVELLKAKRFFVVPNGLKVGIDPDTVLTNSTSREVLFLSNYVRSKGVFEFIDAVKELSVKRSDFTARMVGAPADVTIEEIKQYVEKNELTKILEVSGPLYKKDKFDAFTNCYCFVFPTYYPFELFPGVIQEAMQCGKPVISTYHGVIEDIIDDGTTGLLIPPANVKELTSKIDYLLDHPEVAKEMGRKGREKFFSNYTLQHFENNIAEIFNKI